MEELLKQFMGQMNKRFDQMDKRFDQMDARFDKVELDMANNQTENRSHFRHIEERLEEQQQTFQVVAEEIKGIKIDINYLNQKVAKHDMEINNLHQRFHS